MVGKLTSFQEASTINQQLHEDATWLKEWTSLNHQKSQKVMLVPVVAQKNYNPTDKATMEHPVSHLSGSSYGSFLYARPYKWVQNWVSIWQ